MKWGYERDLPNLEELEIEDFLQFVEDYSIHSTIPYRYLIQMPLYFTRIPNTLFIATNTKQTQENKGNRNEWDSKKNNS